MRMFTVENITAIELPEHIQRWKDEGYKALDCTAITASRAATEITKRREYSQLLHLMTYSKNRERIHVFKYEDGYANPSPLTPLKVVHALF